MKRLLIWSALLGCFAGYLWAQHQHGGGNDGNPVKLMQPAGADLVAGSCTANDLKLDTGGVTKEICWCDPANTWNCASLTAGGPAD